MAKKKTETEAHNETPNEEVKKRNRVSYTIVGVVDESDRSQDETICECKSKDGCKVAYDAITMLVPNRYVKVVARIAKDDVLG